MQVFTYELKRNIMGRTNVLLKLGGRTVHIASYASRSNARRAIRTHAVIREAERVGDIPAV